MFAAPAFGQIDLAGEWTPQFHEDQPERIPEQLRGRHTLR
jgi:hypothetical protein